MLKKIEGSTLFLIGGLIILAVGGTQFYAAEIKGRFFGGK